MTPEQKREYLDRKQASQRRWLAANPEIVKRRNLQAIQVRRNWTPERLAIQKATVKAHYAKCQIRVSQNLCAYSVNCNHPPLGSQKFCLYHWCHGLRQADLRLKAEYSTDELVSLWNNQEGKCAITEIPLVAGKTASIDHIIPVARGGTGVISNVRFIHWAINTMKWDRTDSEFKELILALAPTLLEWAKKVT